MTCNWLHGVQPVRKVRIPYLVYSVQAGFPSPAESYREKLDLNDLLIENAPATFLMRVNSDAMVDAGIHENDLLVIDRSKTPRSGDVVVMRIDTEYKMRRFIRDARGFHLHPENASGIYPDIFPEEGQIWETFGVVNFVIKPLSRKKI